MGMARFSETVTGEARDGVLVATIDNPPVNALSAEVRAGLMAVLDHAETHDDIAGVVLTGAGRIFIGGADIREFGKPPVEPHLPAILDRMEAFAKPVVAAVNGAALGGGCEVALACHGRVAASLAEGIAARASDIDLAMIKGYGFPAHSGGPLFVAADRE